MAHRHVYLLLGEDEYQIRNESERLISTILADAADDLNVTHLDCDEASFPDIESELLTQSIFAPVRVIVLWRVDRLTADDQSRLACVLGSIPEGNSAILTAERLDGRSHLFKTLKSGGIVKELHKLGYKELPAWCRDQARKLGLRIGPREIDLLIQMVGSDLSRLDSELTKLRLFCGDGDCTVGPGMIRDVVTPSAEAIIFDLLDAVGERRSSTALSLVRRMLSQGEPPVKLQFMIAKHIREILQVCSMLESGMNEHQIVSEMKVHPFKGKKLVSQARAFRTQQLMRLLSVTLEADMKMKSSELTPDCWLEMLVARICASD